MKELESWREEQRSAYLYRLLAQIEAGAPRARLFTELAKEAEEQSGIWAQAAARKGAAPPAAFRPDVRTKLVAAMTRRLGPRAMRSILAAMKVRGMSVYSGAHPGHPMPQAGGGPERRHRGLASGGNLRAGVFGVNDGLVSNASLILGVAGAHADPNVILLSGVAGLLAGIFISPNNSALLGSAPRHRQGVASGALATSRNGGMVLGVGLAGAVVTTANAYGLSEVRSVGCAFGAAALAGVVGAVLSAVRAEPRRPQ